MGIQGLTQLLKSVITDFVDFLPTETLRFKKVAIDTTILIFQFKNSFGGLIYRMFEFIKMLRRNKIHPVFVFDSRHAIKEKEETRKGRKHTQQLSRERLEHLKKDLDDFLENNIVSEFLRDVFIKTTKWTPEKSLTGEPDINETVIRRKIESMEKNSIEWDGDEVDRIKELFDAFGIPWIEPDIPIEAETLATGLSEFGFVDAVVSPDSDCLALGSTLTIREFKRMKKRDFFEFVDMNSVLERMNLDLDEFQDLCILLGTDFNNRIKGFGPKSALRAIREHGSIEKIVKAGILSESDVDEFIKVDRTRELMTLNRNEIEPFGELCVWSKVPDWDEAESVLRENEIDPRQHLDKTCFECELLWESK